jgi:hypothetical protein
MSLPSAPLIASKVESKTGNMWTRRKPSWPFRLDMTTILELPTPLQVLLSSGKFSEYQCSPGYLWLYHVHFLPFPSDFWDSQIGRETLFLIGCWSSPESPCRYRYRCKCHRHHQRVPLHLATSQTLVKATSSSSPKKPYRLGTSPNLFRECLQTGILVLGFHIGEPNVPSHTT